MTTPLLISYLAHPMQGPPSGLRVWDDGQVELGSGKSSWKPVTQLGPKQMHQLRIFVKEAQIMEMPEEIPAPQGTYDGQTCDWHAELDGKAVDILVKGWNDHNPTARPLRDLVMNMYSLIAAAQHGDVS